MCPQAGLGGPVHFTPLQTQPLLFHVPGILRGAEDKFWGKPLLPLDLAGQTDKSNCPSWVWGSVGEEAGAGGSLKAQGLGLHTNTFVRGSNRGWGRDWNRVSAS